ACTVPARSASTIWSPKAATRASAGTFAGGDGFPRVLEGAVESPAGAAVAHPEVDVGPVGGGRSHRRRGQLGGPEFVPELASIACSVAPALMNSTSALSTTPRPGSARTRRRSHGSTVQTRRRRIGGGTRQCPGRRPTRPPRAGPGRGGSRPVTFFVAPVPRDRGGWPVGPGMTLAPSR